MGNEGYDYGRKRRTTSNDRFIEWWSTWPWLILGFAIAIGVIVLTIRH